MNMKDIMRICLKNLFGNCFAEVFDNIFNITKTEKY